MDFDDPQFRWMTYVAVLVTGVAVFIVSKWLAGSSPLGHCVFFRSGRHPYRDDVISHPAIPN